MAKSAMLHAFRVLECLLIRIVPVAIVLGIILPRFGIVRQPLSETGRQGVY